MLNQLKKLTKNEIKKMRRVMYERLYIKPTQKKSIVDQFHKLYYDSHLFGYSWSKTYWLGVPIQKCPLDTWIYQEIIVDRKPDIIIECGTFNGGSALFLASICDLVGKGKVISIDVNKKEGVPEHERITYLEGSSISEGIVEKVKSLVKKDDVVLVILDSDHKKDHVLSELGIYSELVTKGSYLIVEDTNLNGHPVDGSFGLGPMEALDEFLKENKDFKIDKEKEKFHLTFNPRGYLKKIV